MVFVNKRYMYWYSFSTSDYDNGKSVITTDHLLSIWMKKNHLLENIGIVCGLFGRIMDFVGV